MLTKAISAEQCQQKATRPFAKDERTLRNKKNQVGKTNEKKKKNLEWLSRMQGYRKLEAAQIVARVENCTQYRKLSSALGIKHNEVLRMRKIHANEFLLFSTPLSQLISPNLMAFKNVNADNFWFVCYAKPSL
ncbi:Biorientation Of Chromosomes In Cell Division Protein 1-Like 1 [Manis pentadactyla]|nr:Biorientation Of Chromosomes In Cell Division Protein 1-Like 1 [Manis pentadactyla]